MRPAREQACIKCGGLVLSRLNLPTCVNCAPPSCGCDERSPSLACQAEGLWHQPLKTLSPEELADHRRTVAAAEARSALVDAAPGLLLACEKADALLSNFGFAQSTEIRRVLREAISKARRA